MLLDSVIASQSCVATLGGHPITVVAEATDAIVQRAARVDPSIESLCDVLFEMRTRINSQDAKVLPQLQGSYSLLRHLPQEDILSTCKRFAQCLEEGTGASQGAALVERAEALVRAAPPSAESPMSGSASAERAASPMLDTASAERAATTPSTTESPSLGSASAERAIAQGDDAQAAEEQACAAPLWAVLPLSGLQRRLQTQ